MDDDDMDAAVESFRASVEGFSDIAFRLRDTLGIAGIPGPGQERTDRMDDLTKERDALRAEVESLRRRLEEEKRRRM